MNMSGNLSGSFHPPISVWPWTCMAIRVANPTMSAAPVPAARQMPVLSC